MKILIKNGLIWDGEKFFAGDVLTNNEIIENISTNITQAADHIIDATGKFVLPGLTDAHTHLQGISSDNIGAQPEMACFPFGVTSTADAEGAYVCNEKLDLSEVKTKVFVKAIIENDNADIDDLKRRIDKYNDKVAGIKIYFDCQDTNITSEKPLKQICKFASDNSLIVMVHPINSPISMRQIFAYLKKGDILTHPFHGGKNNAGECNFLCIKEAQRRGILMDLGFEGYVNTNFEYFLEAIKMGIEPDIISTDLTKVSVGMRGGRYGLTMCMSVAKEVGMSDEAIFKAVTSTPSKALGKEKEWGWLKIGRCADIAVLDYVDEGFNLTDMFGNKLSSNYGYRCIYTISNGNVVYRT